MIRPNLWYVLKEQVNFLNYTLFYKWKHFLKQGVEIKEKMNENSKEDKFCIEGVHRALTT